MSSTLTCPTIDFVFLQNLSGSYSDDLPVLKAQIANVIATVGGIDQNTDFAVASFIDTTPAPMGAPDPDVHQTHLALSSDKAAVVVAINALGSKRGTGLPKARVGALIQVSLRVDEGGFRPDTKRIVMLSTDSAFQQAGGHAIPAGNRDSVPDGTGGEGMDYRSIAQAAAALVASGVFPVFSVTTGQKTHYQTLIDDLGTGAVVVLGSDSGDFSDAVRLAVARACGRATRAGADCGNGPDVIDFAALRHRDGISAVISALQSGADVVLSLPGGTMLTLQGFDLADLGLTEDLQEPRGDAARDVVDDSGFSSAGKNRTIIDGLAAGIRATIPGLNEIFRTTPAPER